jgi:hypothetical protein
MEKNTEVVLHTLAGARTEAIQNHVPHLLIAATERLAGQINRIGNVVEKPWFIELVAILANVDAPELAEDEEAALRRGDLLTLFRYVQTWSDALLSNIILCAEKDPLDENRAFALSALGKRVMDKDWLRARMEDSDFEVQIVAGTALINCGEDTFAIVAELLTRAGEDKDRQTLCCQHMGVIDNMPFLVAKLLDFKEPARLNAVLSIIHSLSALLNFRKQLQKEMDPYMEKLIAAVQASTGETAYQLKFLISKCSALAV